MIPCRLCGKPADCIARWTDTWWIPLCTSCRALGYNGQVLKRLNTGDDSVSGVLHQLATVLTSTTFREHLGISTELIPWDMLAR